MYLLRLCETREYAPRLLEHWLCTMQKHRHGMELILREKGGKVEILSSEDLSNHLPGSRCIQNKKPYLEKTWSNRATPRFQVWQAKGPLLPIKRAAQFEDRVNKERIFPADTLIMEMAKRKNSFIHIKFQVIPEKKRRRVLKKAKRPWFKAERRFDQWESKIWFESRLTSIAKLRLRRALGPLARKAIHGFQQNQKLAKEVMEKTESLHEREDPQLAVLDKLSRPLFSVSVEMSHPFKEFIHGFTIPYLGELRVSKNPKRPLILSAEELACFAPLPHPKNCAAHLHTESTAYLPPTEENPLKIAAQDRQRHIYLLGKTGMGKSSAILHLFRQDLQTEGSIILLDPHGDLIEDAIKFIPKNREKDLIIIDPSQTEYPLALNPVECLPNENPTLKSSALIEMFEVLAKGSWGPRLEYILRNTLLTLLLGPNTNLLDLPRLLTDENFNARMLAQIKDVELLRFWREEFLSQDKRSRQEQIAPILNKVGPLLTSPLLRNIFGQPRGKFNLQKACDSQKILLIKLSKGCLGEDASRMLGMIFISMIQSMLLQRAATPAEERKPVFVFIDEFQSFTTKTLISMLSEARKYGLALTLANQYLTQLLPEIQDAVLGNAGSLISFRTSYQDAKILAPSLGLTEEDLTNLAPFHAYAKLLKNASTLPVFRWEVPKQIPAKNILQTKQAQAKLLQLSLTRFGRKRHLVEEKILSRYNAPKHLYVK